MVNPTSDKRERTSVAGVVAHAAMILRFLSFLGRHGAGLLAAGLFVGLALPDAAHALRPLLPTFIFLLTAATMLRIDWGRVIAHARRPDRIALVVVWSLAVSPIAMATTTGLLGVPRPLAEALVLWAASPPLISMPAIAFLMGLDAALALLVTVAATLLMPLTLPPLVEGLIGIDLGIGISSLMVHLALFVLGAVALAALLRRLIGAERLGRHGTELNGINVLLLMVFAIAIMDGMQARVIAEPLRVVAFCAIALGASLLLQLASFLAFAWLDRLSALTVGLIGGNNNMAIVWANLSAAATVSPDLMLFFACVQLPIYMLPAALAPVYRRLAPRTAV